MSRLRLLLLSNSTQPGHGFLEHCTVGARAHYAGCKKVQFVPYALHDLDAYAAKARTAFEKVGLEVSSLHESGDPKSAAEEADGFFVGGGNTFRLLKNLQEQGLLEIIRRRVAEEGIPYAGASAGSNIACPTISTTNDMPIVQPASFDALELVSFQINPHYIDPDPLSRHMGETRPQRITEYHEENHRPVLGMFEGSWIVVDDTRITLHGLAGARVFRRGEDSIALDPGADLSELLAPQ